jgi:hypothetical protein
MNTQKNRAHKYCERGEECVFGTLVIIHTASTHCRMSFQMAGWASPGPHMLLVLLALHQGTKCIQSFQHNPNKQVQKICIHNPRLDARSGIGMRCLVVLLQIHNSIQEAQEAVAMRALQAMLLVSEQLAAGSNLGFRCTASALPSPPQTRSSNSTCTAQALTKDGDAEIAAIAVRQDRIRIDVLLSHKSIPDHDTQRKGVPLSVMLRYRPPLPSPVHARAPRS